MGLLSNQMRAGAAGGAGGGGFYSYQIANSCRFGVVNSYLTRAISGVTDNTQNTISFWVKRSKISGAPAGTRQPVMGNSGGAGQLEFLDADTFRYASYGTLESNVQLFRDTSAWYHFHIYRSTSNGGGAIYVNGVQVSLTTNTAGSAGIFQNGQSLQIGASNNGSAVFDGYIADVYGIYDQNIAHTEFGEFKNGVWIPKDAASAITFGSHDFHLKFESSGDLGNDSSGNNNDFTVTNVSTHDQMLDSPTFGSEGSANFPAFSPLYYTQSTNITEGNLDFVSTGNIEGGLTNAVIPAGEATVYYFEWCVTVSGGGHEVYIGVNGLNIDMSGSSERGGRDEATCWGFLTQPSGYQYVQAGSFDGRSEVSLTISTGDVVGMVIDRANTTIKWYINNSLKVTSTNLIATGDLAVWSGKGGGTTNVGGILNAGQDSSFAGQKTAGGNADSNGFGDFFYAPPTGTVAYCTGNLPIADAIDPAQTDDNFPSQLFDAQLWTGNGSSGRAITISGAKKPSLSVIKQRNSTNGWNVWTQGNNNGDYDSFGEFNSTAAWYQNQGASGPYTADPTASALTLTAYGQVNASSNTYVNYRWVANGGTTSTNTQGSENSTVEADPSGAFSVVTWSGGGGSATFGHGLSGAPSFMVAKSLTSSATVMDWVVFHKNMNDGAYPANESRMYLNSTGGYSTGALWQNDNNSATLFGVTSNINNSGKDYVNFCFTDVEGYCKADYYVGNGNVDGAFVYLGFRPAWIMIKGLASGVGWNIHDNATSPINLASTALQANTTGAELSNYNIDMVSNGFKIRDADGELGTNGNKYIYLAMAKNPFKYATAR